MSFPKYVMRDFIGISESLNTGFVTIASIPDETIRHNCCLAFNELARLQRGEPERLGGACYGNPHLHPNGTGLYTYTTEHVGDLTNRMAAAWATGKQGEGQFGYEFVNEKVTRALSHARSRYGFERDIREQVKRNYEYEREPGEYSYFPERTAKSLDEWWSQLEEAGLRYAAAHAKLPVYNDAQWSARQAAIEVGNFNFSAYLRHMERLEAHLGSVEEWVAYASLVRVGPNQQPVLMSRP